MNSFFLISGIKVTFISKVTKVDQFLHRPKNLVRLEEKMEIPRARVNFEKFAVNEVPTTFKKIKLKRSDSVTRIPPKSVHLYVVEPWSSAPVFQKTLQLKQKDFKWGLVRPKAQEAVTRCYLIKENCGVFLFGRYYTPKNLAIRLYDGGDIFYRDEVTQKGVDRNQTLVYFWKFLTHKSSFRWPQNCTPVVELRVNSYMFSWGPTPSHSETCSAQHRRSEMSLMNHDSSQETTPAPEISPLNADDLDDPKLVAFLQLLTFGDDDISFEKNFIRLFDGEFCDCQELSLYKNYDSVVMKHTQVKKKSWRRKFLFLKADVQLPSFEIPHNKTVIVFIREGVSLKIKNKTLKVEKDKSYSKESEWCAPKGPDSLQKDFTAAMRKSVELKF